MRNDAPAAVTLVRGRNELDVSSREHVPAVPARGSRAEKDRLERGIRARISGTSASQIIYAAAAGESSVGNGMGPVN